MTVVPIRIKRVQNQLLEITKDHCLSQVVNIHTREDKTLDLLLTNSPSPVNRVKGMPPIVKADHDIVYVEYDIKAKRIQQAPRKMFLFKRADMDGLRDHLARFRDTFLSSDHSHMSVNDMWVSFKSFTRESNDEIPSKGTSPFTPMGEITVDPNGVLKLLNNLKIHKAPGPDGLSARVLKECSSEIAPILALIYNETLAQGTVPDDWRQVNVAPIFKKGEKYDAANY